MNPDIKNRIKYKLKKKIIDTKQFHKPCIDFILRKGNEYVCCVSENSTGDQYICKFSDQIEIVSCDDLVISDGLDVVIEGCVEAYLFMCLENGYEIIDIHQSLHDFIWTFAYAFLEIVELFEYGFKKYLLFCKEIGITYEYMKYYYNVQMDLYEKFNIQCPLSVFFNNVYKEN